MSLKPATAYRLFKFRADGQPYSKAFDHPQGLAGAQLQLELNHAFHSWLEEAFPGYYFAGRIMGVETTDHEKTPENTILPTGTDEPSAPVPTHGGALSFPAGEPTKMDGAGAS